MHVYLTTAFPPMPYVLWNWLFPHRLVATGTLPDDSCHYHFMHLSIYHYPTAVALGVTLAYITTKRYASITMLDNLAYPKGIILRVDIIDHRCVQRCLQSVWSVQAFPKHLKFQWGELYKNVRVHII